MKVSEHTKEKQKIKEANAMIKNIEESQRALLALQLRDYVRSRNIIKAN